MILISKQKWVTIFINKIKDVLNNVLKYGVDSNYYDKYILK